MNTSARESQLTQLAWRLLGRRKSVRLFVRPFLSGRNHHTHYQENSAFRFDAAADADGVVTVIDAVAELNVLATNKLDGSILATPALAGGNIYVRTENHLCAFGKW